MNIYKYLHAPTTIRLADILQPDDALHLDKISIDIYKYLEIAMNTYMHLQLCVHACVRAYVRACVCLAYICPRSSLYLPQIQLISVMNLAYTFVLDFACIYLRIQLVFRRLRHAPAPKDHKKKGMLGFAAYAISFSSNYLFSSYRYIYIYIRMVIVLLNMAVARRSDETLARPLDETARRES